MIVMESEVVLAIGMILDSEVALKMCRKLLDVWLEWRCVVLVNEIKF